MKAKKESMTRYYESLCIDGLAKKEDCTEEENVKFSQLYEDELPDDIFLHDSTSEENASCTYYKYVLAENITQNALFSIAKKIKNITYMLVAVGGGIIATIIICIAILIKLS